MKKKIIIGILALFSITSCTKNTDNAHFENSNIIQANNSGTLETNSGTIIEKNELTPEDEKKKKIDDLRKKLALKGLINRGDINLQNKDYTSALVKYLKILKELPDDEATIKKLGDVYFNLKKFKKSYEYYSKIKDYDKLDNDRAIKALLYFTKVSNENIDYLFSEINSFNLTPEQVFYYKNSLSCIQDFSLCKKSFQDYFANVKEKEIIQKEKEENNEGTGAIEPIPRFEELYNIETALINYENFQIDDLLYKGALVSGAFFENGLYSISIETSKLLLKEKKDYKPLLKVIAKSYYELGNYVDAKLYLIEYNKLVKKDPEASYFLGVVYEKLHEYVLSTIHFKKALNTGYDNTYDLNKRILFNYYELGEINKMLEIFRVLVYDFYEEIDINDFSLAIYYHIVNDQIISAKDISAKSLEKFPESEILNGYMGWILMEEINRKPEIKTGSGEIINDSQEEINIYGEAEKYINKGLEIDNNNAMLNLVKGKLEMSKGEISKSFIYFKKTIALDNNGDFGKIARQELDGIEINKSNEEENIEKNSENEKNNKQ